MKKAIKKKSIATTIVLLIMTLTIIGTNTLFVNADVGGTGKFLEIEFLGTDGITSSNCKVTATKVDSGQIFTFVADDQDTYSQKVGAGAVLLEAITDVDNGWVFSHWEGNVNPTTENAAEYKTVKYGVVKAYFEKQTYTITAIVAPQAPNGTIETSGDGVATKIEGGWSVSVPHGGNQSFSFSPYEDNHVSAIQVDNTFTAYALSYEFTNVQKNYSLVIFFSLDGTAYVPAGLSGSVYLGSDVSLSFTSTTGEGTATQENILQHLLPQLTGSSLILWNIAAGATFTGIVEIALPYAGSQTIQHVWTSDSLDALYSDVSGDGVVDGIDHIEVARAISTSGRDYNATYDVNRDGFLDQEDIHTVDANLGTTLTALNWWVEETTLFIETDHFSIFRGR